MPSSAAFLFIISAKPDSLPPICSAMAFAASLPENSIMPYSISIRGISSLRERRQVEPRFSTSLPVFTISFMSAAFSMASMQVIIFVVLAGYACALLFFS